MIVLSEDVTSASTARTTAPITRNVVVRDRLHVRLDAALNGNVTLVCAPPGYGKSQLVASWARARPAVSLAWANLAACDDSAADVWSTIIDAVVAGTGDAAVGLEQVRTLAMAAPGRVPAALARSLAGTGRLVLVLDDVHAVVAADLHDQLQELVTATQGQLHLVLITRHDPPWPLHRMRLDGILAELRGDDLAFTAAEAGELFEQIGMTMSEAETVRLVQRTEGWAAALRLAALGLDTAPDRDLFLDSVSGGTGYIADYLLREVYEALPPGWRSFLSRIGIVGVVCADLAQALGGGPDSSGRLADLARRNALVHELGNRDGWFRIHPLLVDFVRSRVTGVAEQRSLYRFAAKWYLGQDDPRAALRHAVAAHDWAMAGDLVGTHVVTWTVCQPPGELDRELGRLPREVALGQPGIAIGIAAARVMAGRLDGVDDYVRAATAQLPTVRGRRARRYAFVLGLISVGSERWRGDMAAVLRRCRELATDPAAVADLGLADWAAVHALLVNNTGTSELWTGELEAARRHLADAAAFPGGELVLPVLNAGAHLAYLLARYGELNRAEQVARRSIDGFLAGGMEAAPQAAAGYLAMACICLDRDEVDGAHEWLVAARTAAREPHAALAVQLVCAELELARGHSQRAAELIRTALAEAGDRPPPALLAADLAALAGVATGSSETRSVPGPPPSAVPTLRDVVLSGVRAAVCAADAGEPARAAAALESALEAAAGQRLRRPFLAARSALRDALAEQARPGRAHAAFAVDLLNHMASTRSRRPDGGRPRHVPLTHRESDILRFLGSALTTKEIADTLYISINTVKTHQRAIYQKLGVGGRREAVGQAGRLGLL